MHNVTDEGIDPTEYARVLDAGVDHGGNPVEAFVDTDGGMPMRCCLTDSAPGDAVAIVAWSPLPWQSAYTETGPIFIHAAGCPGRGSPGALPAEFDERHITLRPYSLDRTIDYARVQHVPAGDGLEAAIDALLREDDVEFVHGRNRTGGCYAFTARSAGSHDARADRPA